MKSIINEIGGLSQTGQAPNFQGPLPRPAQVQHSSDFGRVLPLCSKMHDWQFSIKNALAGGQDLYVAASPGTGKTLPYICHWMEQILHISVTGIRDQNNLDNSMVFIERLLFEPQAISKLVVLVPIRTLAIQTANEFKEKFAQMLSYCLDDVFSQIFNNQNFMNQARVQRILGGIYNIRGDNQDRLKLIQTIEARKIVYNKYLNAKSSNDLANSEAYANNVTILDNEIKLLVKNGIENIISSQGTNYGLVAIRTGLGPEGDPKHAPVTIAIYESGIKVINDILPQIKMLVLDEAHLIQDKILFQKEVRNDSRAYSIASALYEILGKLKSRGRDCQLLFLSGTANPSAAENLIDYINLCFGRNIIVSRNQANNPSSITIYPDDSIKNENTLINILKNGEPGTVIVIFSKNRINQLSEKASRGAIPVSLHQIQKGPYQREPLLSGVPKYGGYASPRTEFSPKQLATSAVSGSLIAANIYDPLLRRAVQSGFGYIYRLDETVGNFDQRKSDNEIVADLFTSKKIRVLLSTDAIGIGVNIKVKNMIIPSIEKPVGSGRREEMEPSNLAQLLHRSGRGSFQYAKIVTPQDSVAAISHALSLTPEGFASGATIQKHSPMSCRMFNYFLSLWRAQI